jgi:serpin B
MFGRGSRGSGRVGALRSTFAFAAAAVIVAGCTSTAATASSSPNQTPTPTPTALQTPTVEPTAWPSGEVTEYSVIKGTAALAQPAADSGAAEGTRIDSFALSLLARMDSDGNLCMSPTSIALALAMIRPGAHGTTAAQMDTILGQLGAPGQEAQMVALLNQLRGQVYYIDDEGYPLPATSTPNPSQPDPILLLTVANQLFSQKDMPVEQAYLDALSSTYGAGIGQLDFNNDPESARLTINKWASDNTKGRIQNVLQQGDVNTDTRIALANAIYLKANWRDKFDPAKTAPGNFTTAKGAKVSVPMMSNELWMDYAAGSGYKAVRVPLDAMSSLAMTFVIPDNMAAFQAGLTAQKLDSILGSMKTYDVSLWLPKFSVESRFDLASVLSSMGMTDLFTPGVADLTGINTTEQLFIQSVIHQANMDVDEQGVTAAAVTVALGLGGAAEPPPHVDLHVDHPFLYFIRDRESGAILFMGRVNDASVK